MDKTWMMFEGYWRDLPQNEIDGLPKKSVSANAFEAGWKAAEQGVQADECSVCNETQGLETWVLCTKHAAGL